MYSFALNKHLGTGVVGRAGDPLAGIYHSYHHPTVCAEYLAVRPHSLAFILGFHEVEALFSICCRMVDTEKFNSRMLTLA